MPNPHTATRKDLDTPNKLTRYEVTRDDLPVHCPMRGTSLWNSHPQVYIQVEDHGGEGHNSHGEVRSGKRKMPQHTSRGIMLQSTLMICPASNTTSVFICVHLWTLNVCTPSESEWI